MPVGLTDSGMKMAARFVAFSVDDLDMKEIIAAMNNSGAEKLINVDDEEKGEHVEIFIE